MSGHRGQSLGGYGQSSQGYDQHMSTQRSSPDARDARPVQLRPIKSPGGNAYAFGNLFAALAQNMHEVLLIFGQSCRISTRFSASARWLRRLYTGQPQLRPLSAGYRGLPLGRDWSNRCAENMGGHLAWSPRPGHSRTLRHICPGRPVIFG
jgi:hypothetical protein